MFNDRSQIPENDDMLKKAGWFRGCGVNNGSVIPSLGFSPLSRKRE